MLKTEFELSSCVELKKEINMKEILIKKVMMILWIIMFKNNN